MNRRNGCALLLALVCAAVFQTSVHDTHDWDSTGFKGWKPLWHTRIGNRSNAPETYLVDGRQHVLIAVGDTLYAFTLY
jgi:hypothetical protein